MSRTEPDPGPHPSREPERWLDLYGDTLFRDALLRLGDRSSAADAVQDTFVAAIEGVRAGRYDERLPFRAWLRGILRKKVVDQIRRRVRERPWSGVDADDGSGNLLYRLTGVPSLRSNRWPFDLECAFEREEFRREFERCLGELTDLQRAAFTMKVVDGMATEEVCETLGITANHLGVVLHRARGTLRRELEARWIADRDARSRQS